jgi:hypothetical protein
MLLEGFGQLKNPMTSSGIETATLRCQKYMTNAMINVWYINLCIKNMKPDVYIHLNLAFG